MGKVGDKGYKFKFEGLVIHMWINVDAYVAAISVWRRREVRVIVRLHSESSLVQ